MRKIIEYQVVDADGSENLSEKVNILIGKGWQPFQSPMQSMDEYYDWVVQAMVKYEEVKGND